MNNSKNLEIERKFLLPDVSGINLKKLKPIKILQGYLGFNPVVRVRISDQGCFLGVKGPGTISRLEIEKEITKKEANQLMEISTGKIQKTRYKIPHEKHIWEIDIFEGYLKGLHLAEIELKSEKEKFTLPDFMKRSIEVSDNPQLTNAQLSVFSPDFLKESVLAPYLDCATCGIVTKWNWNDDHSLLHCHCCNKQAAGNTKSLLVKLS